MRGIIPWFFFSTSYTGSPSVRLNPTGHPRAKKRIHTFSRHCSVACACGAGAPPHFLPPLRIQQRFLSLTAAGAHRFRELIFRAARRHVRSVDVPHRVKTAPETKKNVSQGNHISRPLCWPVDALWKPCGRLRGPWFWVCFNPLCVAAWGPQLACEFWKPQAP